MFLKKRYLGYMVLPFLFLGCGISENDEVKEMLDQNTTFVNHVDMSISEILVNGDIKHVTESKLIMEILSEIDHLDMASIENGKYFKRILSVSKYNAIHRMLEHFYKNDYNFDWKKCKDSKNCNEIEELYSEFEEGALAVKEILNRLENDKIDIFKEKGYRLEKLLVLLGDKFRKNIKFPMDKENTDDNEFMRSYYADHAVYNYRMFNAVQKDMGNFSRSDFSHVIKVTKRVKLLSKRNFASTGAYAIPGETIKIIRKDHSKCSVKVFINTLRDSATHQYETYGYKRPKYLQTPHYDLQADETIYLTSPYGGPIQLAFDMNGEPIDVIFENVGEHPYWSSSKDDDSFIHKLNKNDFDWAEVATPYFEVHSTSKKMKTTISEWKSPSLLAEAIDRYMVKYPHRLAGYQDSFIEAVEEIESFAMEFELPTKEYLIVKHMNADQASCGMGCSGNPYDAYWAFSPIGHGDLHELGHSLEKGVFRFEGFEQHASTNPYSFYTISQYNKLHEDEMLSCEALPFEKIYTLLKASKKEKDPQYYLQKNLWKDAKWKEEFMITLQAMMYTQKMGKLENGWHLLARLHLLERERKYVKSTWENKKYSLGFSTYALEEFKRINNNDWMLISLSFAAGLDFRSFLSMYGIPYSEKAAKQVESFLFPSVPQKFFLSTPTGYCEEDQYGAYLDKQVEEI